MAGEECFDQWVASEGGPEAVLEIIAYLHRQIEGGTLVGFTGKDAFSDHLRRSGPPLSVTWQVFVPADAEANLGPNASGATTAPR